VAEVVVESVERAEEKKEESGESEEEESQEQTSDEDNDNENERKVNKPIPQVRTGQAKSSKVKSPNSEVNVRGTGGARGKRAPVVGRRRGRRGGSCWSTQKEKRNTKEKT